MLRVLDISLEGGPTMRPFRPLMIAIALSFSAATAQAQYWDKPAAFYAPPPPVYYVPPRPVFVPPPPVYYAPPPPRFYAPPVYHAPRPFYGRPHYGRPYGHPRRHW
jgi:hypothetical protein